MATSSATGTAFLTFKDEALTALLRSKSLVVRGGAEILKLCLKLGSFDSPVVRGSDGRFSFQHPFAFVLDGQLEKLRPALTSLADHGITFCRLHLSRHDGMLRMKLEFLIPAPALEMAGGMRVAEWFTSSNSGVSIIVTEALLTGLLDAYLAALSPRLTRIRDEEGLVRLELGVAEG